MSDGARHAFDDLDRKYRTLFDSIDEGFCIVDILFDAAGVACDYRFVEANPAFARHTGLIGAVGRTIRELAPAHERFWFDTYAHIAATGESARFEHDAVAIGKYFDVYAFRIGGARTNRVAVLFNDISERKRAESAESQIKALFGRLVAAHEEERRRIARDIHDQLGQQMTALRINLEVLTDRCKYDDDLTMQLVRTQRLAEEADRTADFLTWGLHPPALDHLGLAAALDRLVGNWSERFGVPVEFDAGDTNSLRLARDIEANLYHIAQEALHNVFKHAGATHVGVCLQRHDHDVLLVIEDDGCGFNVVEGRQRPDGSGLGLVSMTERAALVDGTIEIESAPGRGTTVFARVPIKAEA